MNKKYGLIVAASLLLMGCGNKNESLVSPVRPVKTTAVAANSMVRKDFSGMVEAVNYVKLAFRVGGQIIHLPVIEGEKVRKGQLIATLDPRDMTLQYTAAQSAFATVKAQLERNERLLAKQAISTQEYEICQANYEKLKSQYEWAATNLRDTRMTAPFDGTIEKRYVENFQRVNAGEGIVRLVNTEKLRIQFTVPDAYLYLLRTPHPRFQVSFDAFQGPSFHAKLEEYLDISTDGTGIPVSILIDDPTFDRNRYEVKPGFTCRIQLTADVSPLLQRSWTIIPMSAVFSESEGKQTYVWIVKGHKVHKREVVVNAPTGESQVLIASGLQPGETIVTAGVYQLTDGETVKEMQP